MTKKELRELIRSIIEETVTKDFIKQRVENSLIKYNWDKVIIIYDNDISPVKKEYFKKLLLEYEKYKKVPKSNFVYRFDSGNTNTRTKDHIHIFVDKYQQLFAINRDATGHDGSKGITVPKKILTFLPTIGFKVPKDGIIEWKSLGKNIKYYASLIDLSKLLLD